MEQPASTSNMGRSNGGRGGGGRGNGSGGGRGSGKSKKTTDSSKKKQHQFTTLGSSVDVQVSSFKTTYDILLSTLETSNQLENPSYVVDSIKAKKKVVITKPTLVTDYSDPSDQGKVEAEKKAFQFTYEEQVKEFGFREELRGAAAGLKELRQRGVRILGGGDYGRTA